jgi:hypothetical protein
MVKCKIPVEAANARIMDGTLVTQLMKYVDEVKPENVYLTLSHGQRTIYFVLNVPSEDKMPALLEPLWLDWKADVYVAPAMTLADFEKAGPACRESRTRGGDDSQDTHVQSWTAGRQMLGI